MNPFPDNNPNSRRDYQSPNGLENLNAPSDSEIEDEYFQEQDPRVVKQIRRSFLFLTVVGLVVGLFVAAAVLYILNRFDINAQPGNPPLENLQ
ncbi:hypothetical protein [Lyngbya sp. CCY1209]|jgi:hypothetical protein|uniref:hypothetical protein n=1 Tax=Lyngbya sp. CCY1209 TaxID=2886103 RepID=UPI002D2059CA|nr:hypothetical protein [Lyngbya sp. CCY1209]MEB3885373.1 hypothetical protein [Lyngbya sp. CCY1209]